MLRGPHLKLIASHSVRHGIRGGAGLIALLLTLVLGLSLANIVLSPLEGIEQRAKEMGAELTDSDRALLADQVNAAMAKAIDWVIEPSPEQLNYLTNEHPSAVSAILLLLCVVTPLLSCLGGFNQTSGDIASKGLRFLLIRTERTNIFFGRFIGTYLFSACVYLALFVILALYMVVKIKVHSPGEMVLWLASGYVRILLLSLPYIAMCALVSCAIDSAFGSLTISLLVAYLFPLMVKFASAQNEKVGYLQFLTPWGWKYWLFSPMGGRFFGGVAVMLAFTGIFLFLGNRYFSKRDL
jgi:ABC-type transport system involved in multi-copper enzyme maturation permease subunit